MRELEEERERVVEVCGGWCVGGERVCERWRACVWRVKWRVEGGVVVVVMVVGGCCN